MKWALTAVDVLDRRTKHGSTSPPDQRHEVVLCMSCRDDRTGLGKHKRRQ